MGAPKLVSASWDNSSTSLRVHILSSLRTNRLSSFRAPHGQHGHEEDDGKDNRVYTYRY